MSNGGVLDPGCRAGGRGPWVRPIRRLLAGLRPLLLAFGLVVLADPPAPLAAQSTGAPASEAERVLEAFERALNARNVEGALSHFSGDATVQHERTARGAPAVRRWVQQRVDENVHLHMDRYEVRGDRVRWSGEIGEGEWFNRRHEAQSRAVRGEAVVRDGQIVSYSLEYLDVMGADPGSAGDLSPALGFL
jgi:hypothetical protein